jgi:Cd2+/Zn2+-exporting ATPase
LNGSDGNDVALENPDITLMADDLEKLAYALTLAKRNQHFVDQNLVLSGLVIGALVIGSGLRMLRSQITSHYSWVWRRNSNALSDLRLIT